MGSVGTMTDLAHPGPPSEADLLARAVRLALDNVADGQAPFGALVVLDGEVLATGVNTADRDSDPIAHAEVEAVRAACRGLGRQDLTGATMVASCEPCAMCHAACTVAGITRILYAAPKELVPDLGGLPRSDLVEMQAALRRLAPDSVTYVPTPGADEPFTRYVTAAGGRR
jgi:guanine deaminase